MQLSVRDAAQLLQASENQVHAWVDDGEIPFETVDEQVRFNRSELLEWATSRRRSISLDAFRQTDPDAEPIPDLEQALRAGGVHRVDANDRDEVLRQVVSHMPIADPADKELLLEVLLAREALGSTAIGDGIAIPHVRAPAVFQNAPASISLCYLEHPIDFRAQDGRPVHTLFSIISPSIRGHLELLAKLAAALHEQGFKEALSRRVELEPLLASRKGR